MVLQPGLHYFCFVFVLCVFLWLMFQHINIIFFILRSVNINIGTEILSFQCLNCLQTRLFCKSIIPEDSGSSRRALSNASVKTRFKAILKIKDAWFCIPSFTFLRSYVLTPKQYDSKKYTTTKIIKVWLEVKLGKW